MIMYKAFALKDGKLTSIYSPTPFTYSKSEWNECPKEQLDQDYGFCVALDLATASFYGFDGEVYYEVEVGKLWSPSAKGLLMWLVDITRLGWFKSKWLFYDDVLMTDRVLLKRRITNEEIEEAWK